MGKATKNHHQVQQTTHNVILKLCHDKGFNQLTLFMGSILLHQVCLQSMPCGPIDLYSAKCNRSKSHTRLTTLCFKVMTKSAHWQSWSCDLHGCMINLSFVAFPLSMLYYLLFANYFDNQFFDFYSPSSISRLYYRGCYMVSEQTHMVYYI